MVLRVLQILYLLSQTAMHRQLLVFLNLPLDILLLADVVGALARPVGVVEASIISL
jgi:hypothetical protein